MVAFRWIQLKQWKHSDIGSLISKVFSWFSCNTWEMLV